MTMLCSLLAVCSVSARISRQEGTDGQAAIYRLPLFERAVRCTKYFEGWHSEKHHPYVGYGHRLLPGERYSARTMTKRQADALLRKDLRKFVAMFRKFGVDSILLSEISDKKVVTLGYRLVPKFIASLLDGNSYAVCLLILVSIIVICWCNEAYLTSYADSSVLRSLPYTHNVLHR